MTVAAEKTMCPDFKEFMVSTDGCFMFHQAKTPEILAYDVYFLGMKRVGKAVFKSENGQVVCEISDKQGKLLATAPESTYRQSDGNLAVLWTSGVNIIADIYRSKLRLRKTKPSKK